MDAGSKQAQAQAETHKKPKRPSIFREFLSFLIKEKKWWLIPLVLVLLGLVGLLVLVEGTALAPFIYPLF
jgi:hypothetical protein